MKKLMRGIFFSLAVVLVLFVSFLAFSYLMVDSRVDLGATVTEFKNEKPIKRLDSIIISPDSLTAYIEALVQRSSINGMGISIINDNQLIYQRYFGKRNNQKNEAFAPGTIWYGASLSKTIFADIVLQLAEENVIDLDKPLYQYLKYPLHTYSTNIVQQLFGSNFVNYNDLEGDERYKKITARMCLSHTTGLPNWRWIEPDQKLKIKSEPGSRYSYSGEGMSLLQFVIEELTGKGVEQIAIEKVFIPQNMNRSSYVWQRAYEGNYAVGHDSNGGYLGIPKTNVANAAGSLSTTLEEYTRYFLSILQQEKPRYQNLITPQITIKSKQQFGPNALIDTNENDSIRLSYGLGFGLYDTPFSKVFFKEGHLEGWQHYAVGFVQKGTALVIMSNSDNAEPVFNELIEYTTGNTYTPWFWEGYVPKTEK